MNILLKQNTRYGIMLSGGLDSSVLLYLILHNFQKQNIEVNLQPFCIQKKDQSYTKIPGIFNYMKDRFQIELPNPIAVGNTKLPHYEQGASAVAEIKNSFPDINYLFFGSNKVPPVVLNGLAPIRTGKDNPFLIFPFFELYKTDIIKLVEEYNCKELYNLTQTCTENHVIRCNSCWQCNERKWAFNHLNIIDTGSN